MGRIFFVLALCAMSAPSYGDVTLVAKNAETQVEGAAELPDYDRQIHQLDQMSDEISSQIFSNKGGLEAAGKPSRDGMKITLIKVSR